jgi:hypothetical protein
VSASRLLIAVVLALLATLLVGAAAGSRLRRRLDARVSRSRTRRGLAAERAAERLLEQHGYRVLARKLAGGYSLSIDGDPHDVKLSADYLVERNGRELLVEVKTGDATHVDHADTRRQILEYQLAFQVPAILLVDADAGTIREVRFPLGEQRERSAWPLYAVVAASLAALLWWWQRS